MASAPADLPPPLRSAPSLTRPRELEDPLNLFVYHPLAARLARLLAPTPATPNGVSVAGALCIWAAAWAYTQLSWPAGVIAGLSLHMLWHVVDGADGDLARLTGKASPLGEMVDGACDYAGHSLLYVGLAAVLDDRIGLIAWPFGFAAAASHALQTNHAETQRRSYLWWAYGIPWIKHAKAAGDAVFQGGSWGMLTFGWLGRAYLLVASWMNPRSAAVDEAIERAAGDPRRIAFIRRTVRRASRRSLLLQQAVGANPRTIILGLSMALGSPLYFFLAETVLLNLLLLVSLWHHHAVGRCLTAKLARSAPRAA